MIGVVSQYRGETRPSYVERCFSVGVRLGGVGRWLTNALAVTREWGQCVFGLDFDFDGSARGGVTPSPPGIGTGLSV